MSKPFYVDDAIGRLNRLGYYCVEIEVTTTNAVARYWHKYQRMDAKAASGSTLTMALAKAVLQAEEEARQVNSATTRVGWIQ